MSIIRHVLEHVEETDEVELRAKAGAAQIPLHQGAVRTFARIAQPLGEQIHADYRAVSASTLENTEHVAGATADFQHPIAGRQVGGELLDYGSDDLVARAEPEVPILDSKEARKVRWII